MLWDFALVLGIDPDVRRGLGGQQSAKAPGVRLDAHEDNRVRGQEVGGQWVGEIRA